VNKLTVIASDGYKEFVSSLQKEIKDDLYERPTKVTRNTSRASGSRVGDDVPLRYQRPGFYHLLLSGKNDYIDEDGHVTDQYRTDTENIERWLRFRKR
jgi:type III restriction enzyme